MQGWTKSPSVGDIKGDDLDAIHPTGKYRPSGINLSDTGNELAERLEFGTAILN
jgi:hypothetical protein